MICRTGIEGARYAERPMASAWLSERARDDSCYLTPKGRRTGRPHEIEIWFAVDDDV